MLPRCKIPAINLKTPSCSCGLIPTVFIAFYKSCTSVLVNRSFTYSHFAIVFSIIHAIYSEGLSLIDVIIVFWSIECQFVCILIRRSRQQVVEELQACISNYSNTTSCRRSAAIESRCRGYVMSRGIWLMSSLIDLHGNYALRSVDRRLDSSPAGS